jgi:phosphopantetheinyl transferase
MPLVFQQDINANSRMAIWNIDEPLSFFEQSGFRTPNIKHPLRKMAHAAGRFLLRQTFPQISPEQVTILPNGKPALNDPAFQFSITHACNAVAVIGSNVPVGIDLEFDGAKAHRLSTRFCHDSETTIGQTHFPNSMEEFHLLLWTLKEAAYKCFGQPGIRFREQIQLKNLNVSETHVHAELLLFTNDLNPIALQGSSRRVEEGWLSWVSEPDGCL